MDGGEFQRMKWRSLEGRKKDSVCVTEKQTFSFSFSIFRLGLGLGLGALGLVPLFVDRRYRQTTTEKWTTKVGASIPSKPRGSDSKNLLT